MAGASPLAGLRVADGSGRLAGAVSAGLLAELGAETVEGEADVVLGAPGVRGGTIRCAISPAGAAGDAGLPENASELCLQAWGGLMATTGEADGPPRAVDAGVIETFGGVVAATAVLAALRMVDAGGPAPEIDIALADVSVGLLGSFIAQVLDGKRDGFRDGCRHPICAPWNAYATADGSVMLCSSSDAHWRRLLEVIGATEDPRLADMAGRHAHMEVVDALVEGWASGVSTGAAITALSRAGIPAGPIRTPAAALAEFAGGRCPSPIRFTGAAVAGARDATRRGVPALPLSGVRVLEVGPFTAGPLAGRLLSDLGADVVKVEPPGGEVSRRWTPRFGGLSGYFATYNAGKRSIALDLGEAGDQAVFRRLLGRADVLVQNLKTGALDRLGFGADAVLAAHPRLIYCSISGYGADGPRDPALDTVIQASSGMMARVEQGGPPCKIGFSVGDLMAGHLGPLAVLAALRLRDQTGAGQHIDLSMQHGLVWATQEGGAGRLGPFRRQQTAEGWAVMEQGRTIRVRELGDVFDDPLLKRHGVLRSVPSDDGTPVRVLGAPYGLPAHLIRPGRLIGEADADRDAVLRDWAEAA